MEVIQNAKSEKIRNNAGGHYNHRRVSNLWVLGWVHNHSTDRYAVYECL